MQLVSLFTTLLLTLGLTLGFAPATHAQNVTAASEPSPSQTPTFPTCLADIKAEALVAYSETNAGAVQAIEALYGDIAELPQVVAADRKQAEFTQSFQDYYQRRVTQTRIDKGRALRQQHAGIFQPIAEKYAVQPAYLIALWGLETNFGGYMGKLAIPSALATLACDPRRSSFFRAQLLAITEVVVRGDIPASKMVGSWAGAMGHMQFMPTTYLEHAVDHDGDGKANVYESLTDAMASASNYLKSAGWQSGYRWGREILLPEDFAYNEARQNNWQPLKYWRDLGVTDTSGNLVSSLDLPAAIVLPTGHKGPAFIVYPNFKVLMKWNRSVNYAIAVGRLADRIAGLGQLSTPFLPPELARFRTEEIIQLQTALTAQGYDTKGADGVLGPATRGAIRNYQSAHQLIPDGFPSPALFAALTQ